MSIDREPRLQIENPEELIEVLDYENLKIHRDLPIGTILTTWGLNNSLAFEYAKSAAKGGPFKQRDCKLAEHHQEVSRILFEALEQLIEIYYPKS